MKRGRFLIKKESKIFALIICIVCISFSVYGADCPSFDPPADAAILSNGQLNGITLNEGSYKYTGGTLTIAGTVTIKGVVKLYANNIIVQQDAIINGTGSGYIGGDSECAFSGVDANRGLGIGGGGAGCRSDTGGGGGASYGGVGGGPAHGMCNDCDWNGQICPGSLNEACAKYSTCIYGSNIGLSVYKGSGGGGGNSFNLCCAMRGNNEDAIGQRCTVEQDGFDMKCTRKCCANGGAGGGGIALIAKNRLVLNTGLKILMNGLDGENVPLDCPMRGKILNEQRAAAGGGGGAGGDITLAGNYIELYSTLNANGGKGGNGVGKGNNDEGGSGGGGGRIKIIYGDESSVIQPAATSKIGGAFGSPGGIAGGEGTYTSNFCFTPECTNGAVEKQACNTGLPGICSSGEKTRTCVNGRWGSFGNCIQKNIASSEVCDSKDNDCDGQVDEGLGNTTCGVGICMRSVQNCVNGVQQTCTPGLPGTENCNKMDDDCDGLIDEQLACDCTATIETCDGKDNDCDGFADDENVCCGFDSAAFEWYGLEPSCLVGKSIGAGKEISIKIKSNGKCAVDYDTIGIYRKSANRYWLKNSMKAEDNESLSPIFGDNTKNDQPIIGDWDGDGVDTIGVYRPATSTFFLSYSNRNPKTDLVASFGVNTDKPIIGDWDGDGVDTIGVYRPATSRFIMSNSNSKPSVNKSFSFGVANDKPVIGDWNNDKKDEAGVYRDGNWFLDYNGDGIYSTGTDININGYGSALDLPVVGDWDGDGVDTIGYYSPSTKGFHLRNSNSIGPDDRNITYGIALDLPVVGDWDGNKKSRPYVKLNVIEQDTISGDDESKQKPVPSEAWFDLNGEINAKWNITYEEDESGNPEYYFEAEFIGLDGAEKSSQLLNVKYCKREIDKDCDGVEDGADLCDEPDDECMEEEVGPNGCELVVEEECIALWDCSDVLWGECENGRQKRKLCESGNCCDEYDDSLPSKVKNCNCNFDGTIDDFEKCGRSMKPKDERTCAEEEEFPVFSIGNLITVIILLSLFYSYKIRFKKNI